MAGSKWNPATLKAAVLDLTRRHGPLTCVALRRRAAGLYDALRTRYGTITKAFEALGVPYIRPVRRWSREKVIEAIQARHRQGLALNGRQAAKLQYAARVWLGSWPAALCAAGLDSDQFRVFKRWSSQRVLEELGAWVRQHGTLNADKLARTEETLYAAAGSHFGSLEKAAQAGKLPFERLIVNWSYDKIFEEIRILKRAGQSLAPGTSKRRIADS